MIEQSEPIFIEATRPRLSIAHALLATLGVIVVLMTAATVAVTMLNRPPATFAAPTVVTIEPGTSVSAVADTLEAANVVRSSTLLYLIISLWYEPNDIKASTYAFSEPLTATAVAKRLASGDFTSDLIRFTHIEGERATHIADAAVLVLENFDKELFLRRAVPLEGKLYPETYYIPKSFTADQLVDLMLETYERETATLTERMNTYTLSADEILVLASILEREANSTTSMRMVSGILQRRLAEGMPLQADASIEYVLDKPLKELTPDDLKVDSPYNTYTNRGLPPTPIGNPGREAILAVLEPTASDYVFYITDPDGNFHYARTYDEHLNNIARYLR